MTTHLIVGTAGHIDHGKTTLVRALTGVDTDRLPEEKRRGITIELGFAPLSLDGIGTVGIVDVPGHEAFVRTMVAGATGIDVAMLVIAADEGVMPQTREHVLLARQVGVPYIVVALNKSDMVDDEELLELVELEVRELLSALVARNQEFHGAIVQASRNRRLEHLISRTVEIPLMFKAFFWYTPHERTISNHYHRQIQNALEAGDADRAEIVKWEHDYEGRETA